FKGISEVHSMKIFSISLDAENEAAAKKTADEMCRKLLANPVINSYDISIKSE
ncbi:MAG: phosphoribosylformylglycinamidine synthase subunit PurS, partial [Candidatus Aenigmarchaeota archaeon]|nr:phosphoribosylformylglycinamidine synthase subunit PurS [Candidatus Aenigmarchaeota archaeon]